ncbi:MAG TPA: hypothetical protein VGJ02_06815 [Pyrinomonadaceae bacterium]|jgi:hypothetical protein
MKRAWLAVVILFLSAVWGCAQFQIPEINKVKEIKLLESTAFDVQRIMVGFETTGWKAGDLEQRFSTDNFSVDITYSSGLCSEDDEIWNAKQWTVTKIEIKPDDSLKVKDLGYDFGKFMKEQMYSGTPRLVIYHDKKTGMAFKVDEKESEIEKIILFPPKDSKVGVCDNDTAKEFLKYESWFSNIKLKDRRPPGDRDVAANVTDLTLSESEISVLRFEKQIRVKTTAVDPENDVLTYQYIVSGGKIIGTGAEVVWDLANTSVGTYTITAGVDDGCGICGKTVTKTVAIK